MRLKSSKKPLINYPAGCLARVCASLLGSASCICPRHVSDILLIVIAYIVPHLLDNQPSLGPHMSNRSSNSTRSHSPSSPLPSSSSAPQSSMLHVLSAPILRPPSAHYTPHLTHTPRASPPSTSHFIPPPEPMRAPESSRGTKRARSEDREEERQGSFSESDSSEDAEQPVLPAPKKRTRTLMTPDQLTALHRLLSMVSPDWDTCCARELMRPRQDTFPDDGATRTMRPGNWPKRAASPG